MKSEFGIPESAPPRPLTIGELISAAGFLIVLATLLGRVGSGGWFTDLFSHFPVQYALLLGPTVIALLVSRRWRSALVLTLGLAVNLAVVVPAYFGELAPLPAGATPWRAMLLNVHTANDDHERTGEAIAACDPDLLVLEEVSEAWMDGLAEYLAPFPHREVVPRDDNFGIGLFSKRPFTKCEVLDLGPSSVPSILAHLESGPESFAVLATHPLPPSRAWYWRQRNEHLAAIPRLVDRLSVPLLLLGDLNTTPWNGHFRHLLRDSGLADSTRGRGVHPTWPASLGPFGIPLDHCLHSPEIVVTSHEVGAAVGSDHLPVIVEFVPPRR